MHYRIRNCKLALLKWKMAMSTKENVGKRNRLIQLGQIQSEGINEHIDDDQKLQTKLQMKLKKDELKWKQIVKQHWLLNGDKNTNFYHLHANQRRKNNRISQVLDPYGSLIINQLAIDDIFSSYFLQLVATSNTSGHNHYLQVITPHISEENNLNLLANFSKKKVIEALFMMNPLGAPGPNGFPAQFYQKYWPIFGNEVCKFVIDVLNRKCPGIGSMIHS